jgi:pyruvate ferredoxin oxidoreductase beta subunit
MAQLAAPPQHSMNEAHEQDPFNNSCYGSLVDTPYKLVNLPVLDVIDFNERIIRSYEDGSAEKELPADLSVARSLVPAGTATLRDFSNIAPEIPIYIPENCTGCMDCVTECPDTAILGKVLSETQLEEKLATIADPADQSLYRSHWSRTKKYYEAPKKKGLPGGMFNIMIDPSKCKGCAECVTVCDDNALKMVAKTDEVMTTCRKTHRYFKNFGPSNDQYINDSLLIDMMLKEETLLYTGGAGSCAGCGEGTALRMLCAATGSKYGDQWGIVAATGCNTVYTSTYPYNPYLVPWTNSLFENAPADAIGVRMRWDQMGWGDKPIWCIGGDGAMFDIGFQSLSRMLASGMNIKVFVLDTQVYSNTGGQASTSSYTGQNTKMSVHGKTLGGKQERRKEIAQIAMMHPRTFVAQTTCAHINHFYKSVLGALEFDGPAILSCYTTCQPEHGVADNMAGEQARLAVDTQGEYDPRAALAPGQPGHEGRLVHQPQDQGDDHLHRLRPQRRPLLQALRPRRQPLGDPPEGDGGPPRQLACPARAGRAEVSMAGHRAGAAPSRPWLPSNPGPAGLLSGRVRSENPGLTRE